MNEAELKAIFHEHKDAVYGFAWRMSGDPALAEDVAQEAFLELIRSPESWRPERGSLRGFLLGIARHRLARRWREAHRWDALDEQLFVAAPLDPAAAQRRDRVGVAVQSLPPLQREALVLFEFEGLTLEEIARATGAETGAIKARLQRARENLRRLLAPLMEGESNAR